MARLSRICSGVSWLSIDIEVAVVAVPKLPVTQFGCAAHEEVAPRRVLGAVAQLLEGVRIQLAGRGVIASVKIA